MSRYYNVLDEVKNSNFGLKKKKNLFEAPIQSSFLYIYLVQRIR